MSDFPDQPTYQQSISTNESWVAITTTRTDPDGSKTQRVAIEAKPAKEKG